MKKREDPNPTQCDITDPKPPVIHSGHFENKKCH